MSRVDINTAVSNQFLRILYSILIPGFIPTCIGIFYLGHFINENCLNLLSLGKKEFNLAILISGTLTIGFIIEIFGVWLESKYIDNHISNQSKYEDFESVWESYLKLDFELTKNIILVQYYRTILTKFKFLINLVVSLWLSFILITIFELTLIHYNLNSHFLNFCLIFISYLILNFGLTFYLTKRAIFCAIILHTSRRSIVDISKRKEASMRTKR